MYQATPVSSSAEIWYMIEVESIIRIDCPIRAGSMRLDRLRQSIAMIRWNE